MPNFRSQSGLLSSCNRFISGEITFVKFNKREFPREDRPRVFRGDDGKVVMRFPFFAQLGAGFQEVGPTEIASPFNTPDFGGHIDSRPQEWVNVHYTALSTGIALFGDLDRDLFADEVEIDLSCPSLRAHVTPVEFGRGDIICFRGGKTPHQFVSTDLNRISLVRAYKPL
jgi:hypothetical protein